MIEGCGVLVHLLIKLRSMSTAACEKSIACSTCHVILDSDVYDVLEEPSDDENDMLDMAFGLTDTSVLVLHSSARSDVDSVY